MVELKYIGKYQPQGMIVETEIVETLLDSGDFVGIDTLIEKPKKKIIYPTKKWKEIKIYDWIKENNIPIDYVPSRDRKDDVLDELKEGGYLDDTNK